MKIQAGLKNIEEINSKVPLKIQDHKMGTEKTSMTKSSPVLDSFV